VSYPAVGRPRNAEEATLVELAEDFGPSKVTLFRVGDRLMFTCSSEAITYLIEGRLRRYRGYVAILNRTLTP
jgi:hypothetical protein